MPTVCTALPSAGSVRRRLVPTATALMKPRFEDTFTRSPAAMPSSFASPSPISTNCSGCRIAFKRTCLDAILQPEQFVEIGEGLAKELGIAAGDRVKVSSNRGFIKAVAVVTKRLRTLPADGKAVHTVGIPIHWGFTGLAKAGFLAHTLTPVVGDGNSQTPEFKSFLVKVEKL